MPIFMLVPEVFNRKDQENIADFLMGLRVFHRTELLQEFLLRLFLLTKFFSTAQSLAPLASTYALPMAQRQSAGPARWRSKSSGANDVSLMSRFRSRHSPGVRR
ncbi:hypothetical protein ACIPF8_02080 [Collimonas sp. NPDC087041]|uniref:hypothetical protein n=1 Tax=Collimonas sp. NPDC087041 TaxID=3363960 RepID=UPI0037FACC2E